MGCASSNAGHNLSTEGKGQSGDKHQDCDFNKNVEKGTSVATCPNEKEKSQYFSFALLNPPLSGNTISSPLKPGESSDLVKKLMRGDMSVNCPSMLKTVRIFVSSTFTDTQHERNWLMEKVYPRLKEYCQSQGYDFQVVDMRWGIRDVAQDDHSTTEICLQEVDLCKTQSTGPCFLSLMSHKYGYRDFPRKIPAEEFSKLVDNIEDEDVKQELLLWFMKDENEVPPTFVLQPISLRFPDSISDKPEVRREALSQWNAVKSKMHASLAVAASKVLSEKTAEMYIRSVSEAEIMTCLPYAPKDNVLWYRRIIRDIEEVDANTEGNTLRRFKDFTNDPLKDNEAKELLKLLQEDKMKAQLKKSNIKEYTVQWQPGKGIDPEKNESHRQYLTELCNDAEEHIKNLLQSAFNQQEYVAAANPIYDEVVQHTVFCQGKCKVFHGRNESLKKLQEYLKGPSNAPYVVHGPSGCGKTSLMAMTVDLANATFGDNVTTVFRFLGTTPESSNLPSLLTSLIMQIRVADGENVQEISNMTVKQLSSEFVAMLKQSRRQLLVVILDSLDQLDPSYEAHQLQWLNTDLGKNVKVVLSTLPEEQYGILPILQDKLNRQSFNLLAVPSLSNLDTVDILDKWLKSAGRTLTTFQQNYVINSFQQCPLPLFLKLSFDQACQWKSYQPQNLTVLQSTVKGCIHELFRKMEDSHGKIFVSKTLGYLTASQTGLSEAELEDILSCDEEVLNDVYRFWTPPLRRLPPYLLIRMKRDLGQYVVYRGIDGKQVFNWYHRQFIETSHERYCCDSAVLEHLHQGLADFFAGSWANGKSKPYTDKNKMQSFANRYVASQPIVFGTELNERKLNRQAYHRTMARQLDLLKSECLMNYKFVTSKLKCSGLRGLLDDYRLAKSLFPNDVELIIVSEALQLSQHALSYDLKTFPSQMLGRIKPSEVQNSLAVSNFLAECQDADHVYLQPDRPILTLTGGQLVHTIAEHSSAIKRLLLNKSGTVAVTFTQDDSLRTYDVQEGKPLKSVEGVGKSLATIEFACKDSLIVINSSDAITAFDIVKVSQKWTVKMESPHFVIGGENDSVLVVFSERNYGFFMAETGEPIGSIKNLPESVPMALSFSENGPSVGHEKWAVTCDSGLDYAFLFEIKSQSFIKFDQLMKFDENLEENEKLPCKLEMMLISHDGETLYVAEYYDEKIYCIHTQTFETLKAFNACKPNRLENFHLSADGQFIYFPHYNSIRVWDLSTGKKALLFNNLTSNDIDNVFSSDMNVFVATYLDRVRIFDLSRGDTPGLVFEDPDSDDFEMNEVSVLTCQHTDNRHLFLVVWEVGVWSRREQILALFDASTATILKRFHYNFEEHPDGKITKVTYMKDWQAMVQTKRRVRILDLKSMEIKTTLEAVIPYYCLDVVPVNGGKEMALVSKEDNNIKIMDCATGKVNDVLTKTKEVDKVWNLVSNESGRILIASCEGPFLVFDIAKRTLLFEIKTSETQCSEKNYNLYDSHITSDDTHLIFLAEHALTSRRRRSTNVASIHVFNLKQRIHERELSDPSDLDLHKTKSRGQRYRSFKMLDETKLITTHEDFVLRIFNFQTGSILQRLKGHNSVVDISYKMGSPIVLTHGGRSEENAIRLWDTTDFQCLAVYSYDDDMTEFHFIETDSCKVLSFLSTEMQPLLFSLQGQGSEKFNVSSVSQINNEDCPKFERDGHEDLALCHPSYYGALEEDDRLSVTSSISSDFGSMDDLRSMTIFR